MRLNIRSSADLPEAFLHRLCHRLVSMAAIDQAIESGARRGGNYPTVPLESVTAELKSLRVEPRPDSFDSKQIFSTHTLARNRLSDFEPDVVQ